MSRLDDAIADVVYVLDSLMALRNIYRTGKDCHSCGNVECPYDPDPGQQVAFNCPIWRSKDENHR